MGYRLLDFRYPVLEIPLAYRRYPDGGVPEVLIEVDDLTAYNVGYLIYFFWRACACSGYLLSVNPFNQPGVESYKKNMFALLGKPGYEGLTAELEAKLK